MKKMLLPILAVIFAVGFSAFTNTKTQSHNKPVVKSTVVEDQYFWYELRTDGKIAGDVLNPEGKDFKSNVIEGGANELTNCSDISSAECLAGCNSSSLHAGSTPDAPTMTLDNRIHQD